MQVEIITPETKIFAGEAEAVQLPGIDGSFQVLNNHAPIISALKEGAVKLNLVNAVKADKLHASVVVDNSGKVMSIAIKGGVLEFQNNKMIVLAE